MTQEMASTAGMDPVLVSVVANRIHAIAQEMAETMLRTARSPIFSEALDFVTCIFTGDGRWVATKDYIPVLAGSAPTALQAIRDRFEGDIADGDVFILNDPYWGNNHPPDVTICKPVFYEHELVFWVLTKGHAADIGGGGVIGYNPYSRDCWEDALRIPPVKLYSAGEYARDAWELILCNIRLREIVEGDFHCQIGACNVAERGLRRMLERLGTEVVDACLAEYLSASERRMRAEIRALPNGRFEATRYLDNAGGNDRRQIAVKVAVEIADESITFDFTGSDPQVGGYVNSPRPNTIASAYIGLFGCVDPDLRMSAGSTAPVRVLTEPGTLLDPIEPAPTTLCTLSTCEAIVEAIWDALAQAGAPRANAAWTRWCGIGSSGMDESRGRPYAAVLSFSQGGGGACDGFDGWDAIGTPVMFGGGRTTDVELHELSAPFTVLRAELLQDSGGAGEFRGGLGCRQTVRVEQDGVQIVYYGSGNAENTKPFGVHGAGSGGVNRAVHRRASGDERDIPSNSLFTADRGDIVDMVFSGGGGYGDPARRPVRKVLADLEAGFISRAAAEDVYGLAFRGDSDEMDEDASSARRAELAGSVGETR